MQLCAGKGLRINHIEGMHTAPHNTTLGAIFRKTRPTPTSLQEIPQSAAVAVGREIPSDAYRLLPHLRAS